jgi:hypothetical protein
MHKPQWLAHMWVMLVVVIANPGQLLVLRWQRCRRSPAGLCEITGC